MAGGGYAQAGMGALGGTLGGIGDIISAFSYKQPKLEQATGMEQRLRQLTQSQLLGGGQQLLGATALYNQLAPILMGQLPGMHYVPPTGGGPGMGGDTSGGGAGGAQFPSYREALGNMQNQTALTQRQTALKAQIKGMKPSPERRQARKDLKALKRQIKGLPTAAQYERQAYMAGTTPDASMYDIRQGPPSGGPPAPSMGSSLGDINDLLGQLQGGYQSPTLMDYYQGAY